MPAFGQYPAHNAIHDLELCVEKFRNTVRWVGGVEVEDDVEVYDIPHGDSLDYLEQVAQVVGGRGGHEVAIPDAHVQGGETASHAEPAGDVLLEARCERAAELFKAVDAETGEELWKFQTGSGIVGQPITWEMDGDQYVAVTSGWGGAVPLWGGEVAKRVKFLNQGGSLWVFKIPDALAKK